MPQRVCSKGHGAYNGNMCPKCVRAEQERIIREERRKIQKGERDRATGEHIINVSRKIIKDWE